MGTMATLDAEQLNIVRFMADWANKKEAVPSVRQIAKGCEISIRQARRQMANLEAAGLFRRTIRGLEAPKDWQVSS